ncbi:hypothetical protein AGMMS49938_01800 [Fibrobacterales bacterium]|nr:hypothetical protein AGMMS49938_01800 [Fibrobacterales bacterium]
MKSVKLLLFTLYSLLSTLYSLLFTLYSFNFFGALYPHRVPLLILLGIAFWGVANGEWEDE